MHCSDCGTILLAQTEVPPLGHTYQAAATPPTCTEAGYSTHTCSRCNDSYVSNSVDALGHREVIDGAVDATCTQSGLTAGSHCERCGQVLVPQTKTSPLAHMYKKTVTLPTCTEAGYTTYICTRCQDSYTADHTESLGHRYGGPIFSWSETLSQATAARVCPCGEEISAQCTLSWDDSKPGKLTITATAELENQVFTDSKEILSSMKQGVITISLPCEVPGLHITAAAYGPSGQMTNLLIPELADDSLTKTFPFSGDTIRLFFLDSQWIPLFPALTLP